MYQSMNTSYVLKVYQRFSMYVCACCNTTFELQVTKTCCPIKLKYTLLCFDTNQKLSVFLVSNL